MRVIAKSVLAAFWLRHPDAETSLTRWLTLTKSAEWRSIQDVLMTFPNAKVINGERVRFPVHGGAYRLIVAFDFGRQVAFVKFIGTHAEYDAIDAAKISLF